jgi:putative ABC transport system substrate-binding protein
MVDVIHKTLPEAKSVGTIYNASEANSVKVISVARELFAHAGMKLEEVTVASSSEVLQAGQALVGRGVDAVYIQGDNTVIQGFDAVVKAAHDAKRPLFVDDPDSAKRGALACVGLGYYRPGYAAARPLSRVLLGESPAGIPMEMYRKRQSGSIKRKQRNWGSNSRRTVEGSGPRRGKGGGSGLKEASADQKFGEKVN